MLNYGQQETLCYHVEHLIYNLLQKLIGYVYQLSNVQWRWVRVPSILVSKTKPSLDRSLDHLEVEGSWNRRLDRSAARKSRYIV